MTLDTQDFEALRLLIREEVHDAITPFREEVNHRFSDVYQNFDELYKRSDKHDLELKVMNKRLDKIDTKIDCVQETLDSKIDRVQETLDSKIDRVQETLDSKIDRVQETLEGSLHNIENRVTILEQEAA